MIAWLNGFVLVLSTLLTLLFYVWSAGPAALEKRIGPAAYRRCTWYRWTSGFFMTLASLNYVIYFFYPLPISLPLSSCVWQRNGTWASAMARIMRTIGNEPDC